MKAGLLVRFFKENLSFGFLQKYSVISLPVLHFSQNISHRVFDIILQYRKDCAFLNACTAHAADRQQASWKETFGTFV